MNVHAWGAAPLVLLLVASLVPVAPLPAEPVAAPASWDGATLAGAMRHLDGPAYEPTLAITRAGNVFYTGGSPQNDPAIPGEAWVHGSYDNGATWVNTTSAIAANDFEVYDPYLTSDPVTGRLYRLMMQAFSVGGNGCMQLIWSDDEGATWGEDPDLCISPPFHDHESLASGLPRGPLAAQASYPSFTYVCLNHLHGTDCATSLDGARTFLPPVPVFASVAPQADPYCGGLNGPVRTDSGGRAFVARIHCDMPKVAVSEDGGLTWTVRDIPGPASPRGAFFGLLGDLEPSYIDVHVLSLALDASDALHVLYTAGDGMPFYLHSRDQGRTWSAPRMVAAPGITAADRDRLAIAAAAPGHVAFAYLATDHAGGYDTGDWTGARWGMKLGVLTDAFGAGEVLWTQVNPEDDPLGLDACALGRCTECPDELCPGMYDYIDVEIAPDGRPWIAMVDVCHEACAASGAHDRAVAAVGTLAAGPSLTRPGEALPPLGWG